MNQSLILPEDNASRTSAIIFYDRLTNKMNEMTDLRPCVNKYPPRTGLRDIPTNRCCYTEQQRYALPGSSLTFGTVQLRMRISSEMTEVIRILHRFYILPLYFGPTRTRTVPPSPLDAWSENVLRKGYATISGIQLLPHLAARPLVAEMCSSGWS